MPALSVTQPPEDAIFGNRVAQKRSLPASEKPDQVAFNKLMDKPSLPKGTRDFGPSQMAKRYFIIEKIRNVFQKYGFQPLETPAMENLETLTGKYGDEGDQLLFRILNSGDFLSEVDEANLVQRNLKFISNRITEKGLRYDLTVPFARYVVMNRHEIALPFKRFQIQPVWRADRPQKGRYREFYQCDADVVGTDSLICEAEIILMIKEVFQSLGVEGLGNKDSKEPYTIKVNHRGILSGLAELAGARENESALFVAIDKLDKIGEEKVKEELRGKGFGAASLETVFEILNFKGNTAAKIELLQQRFAQSEKGMKGVKEFSEVLELLKAYGVSEANVEFDISLARGLSYYTGCIFEVKINHVAIGSVSGGGRYDNLTQAFGSKERLSGVGISFGIDRIYDALEELQLFPREAQIASKVLVCHLDGNCLRHALGVVNRLRQNGIAAEVYPEEAKLKKQLEYANKKLVPYTIVLGSEEIASGQLALKNMQTGEQANKTVQQIIDQLK